MTTSLKTKLTVFLSPLFYFIGEADSAMDWTATVPRRRESKLLIDYRELITEWKIKFLLLSKRILKTKLMNRFYYVNISFICIYEFVSLISNCKFVD